MPVVLPPVPRQIDLSEKSVLVVDDVADTGGTLALVRDFLRRTCTRDPYRRDLREAPQHREMRLRLAPDGQVDQLPVEFLTGYAQRCFTLPGQIGSSRGAVAHPPPEMAPLGAHERCASPDDEPHELRHRGPPAQCRWGAIESRHA